ncbi:MAG: type I 3-dehydroquinate dehydratase [Anaerovoracaceae bacterium]
MREIELYDNWNKKMIPNICAPICGNTCELLISEIELAKQKHCDVLEWRIDYFDDIEKLYETSMVLNKVWNKPLIYTFRSYNQGGKQRHTRQEYIGIINSIISNCGNNGGFIDVEPSTINDDKVFMELKDRANEAGFKVISSHHIFETGASVDEAMATLEKLRAYNPQVLKFAITLDITSYKNLTKKYFCNKDETKREGIEILIAMGKDGVQSRIGEGEYIPFLTFGSLRETTASGQVDIDELRARICEYYNISV